DAMLLLATANVPPAKSQLSSISKMTRPSWSSLAARVSDLAFSVVLTVKRKVGQRQAATHKPRCDPAMCDGDGDGDGVQQPNLAVLDQVGAAARRRVRRSPRRALALGRPRPARAVPALAVALI